MEEPGSAPARQQTLGRRLLATADAEPGRAEAGCSLRAQSAQGSWGLSPPLPWPPNKPKREKCIVSIRRTDRINLKSKGPLPAHPTPGLASWPVPSSPGCFPAAGSARAGVGLACSLLLYPRWEPHACLDPFPSQSPWFP